MSRLIPSVILAGLAAAVSPVAVMVLLAVMMKEKARRNSLLFLLGYTLILIALGVVGVYVLKAGGSGTKSKVDGYVDIALGALCFAAMLLSLRPKKKQAKPATGGKDLKASRAFLLGIIAMLTNVSTIVCYLSGAHEISKAEPGLGEGLLALALLIVVTLITVLIPIGIYFIFPTRSDKVLSTFNAWLSRHSKVIGASVLLIFGAYLLIKGIKVVA